jgi:hypothetical protein
VIYVAICLATRLVAILQKKDPAQAPTHAATLTIRPMQEDPRKSLSLSGVRSSSAPVLELLADAVYPADPIKCLIRRGQEEGSIRDGRSNLLATIFPGCLLCPLLMAQGVQPGALDLLHDRVICEAAWTATARPATAGPG